MVYGSTGMESAAGDTLSGTADQLFYQRISDLLANRQATGSSVQLTINPKVQRAAWNALGKQRGAVVAIAPKTGAILAMVSKPGFDPNLLAGHDRKQLETSWKRLVSDPGRPMDNRVIAGNQYAPGSVFKIVTAASALSSGKYTPDSQVPGPSLPEAAAVRQVVTQRLLRRLRVRGNGQPAQGPGDVLQHRLRVARDGPR